MLVTPALETDNDNGEEEEEDVVLLDDDDEDDSSEEELSKAVAVALRAEAVLALKGSSWTFVAEGAHTRCVIVPSSATLLIVAQ